MLTLILGGARSGKSDFAQRLALASSRPVLFVATLEPGDDEMRARIAGHRSTRPAGWRTIETPLALYASVAAHAKSGEFVLIDCLTVWASNMLIDRLGDAGGASAEECASAIAAVVEGVDALLLWTDGFDGEVAIVSNEVGFGVVPAFPLGRIYRDALGAANRRIAREAGCAYLLAAGLAVDLKAAGARPVETFATSADA